MNAIMLARGKIINFCYSVARVSRHARFTSKGAPVGTLRVGTAEKAQLLVAGGEKPVDVRSNGVAPPPMVGKPGISVFSYEEA